MDILKILSIILTLLLSINLQANPLINGVVTNASNEPIGFATVHWLGTTIGNTANDLGEFEIETTDATNQLVVSSLSYGNDTITVLENQQELLRVVLNNINVLDAFIVEQRSKGTVNSRTSVITVQKITAEELKRAACCNLSESFETNPSVDVAYGDAATGAKQIRLLGLSGTYVQMMTENIPNLKGIASNYGLSFIPGPWMESIQISKGTGSVINGYESVTGQINVEYKKPTTSDKISANLFLSEAGRVEANLDAALKLDSNVSTGILLHASDEFFNNDRNRDNFMDMPRIRQFNGINRWYVTKGNYLGQFFLHALNERRMGGQIKGDSPYMIEIETQRYEMFVKNAYIFDAAKERSIGWILNGTWHSQQSGYGESAYNGEQGSFYSNLIFQTKFSEKHKLSTGWSVNYDNFDERLKNIVTDTFNLKNEFVTGVFGEYTFNLHEKFVLLAGIRGDYNAYFDRFLFTPRLHIKYVPIENIHLRATVGRGYHTTNILAENNYLLTSSRKWNIPFFSVLESAWNYGLTMHNFVPIGKRELSVLLEFFHTDFDNQVVTNLDTDAHKVIFEKLNGKSYSNNFQIEANMEIIKGLTVTVAHRITDVKTTIDGELREKPFTPRWRSLLTASYSTKFNKWQFDYTLQANGGGRLADPDINNPLWEKNFKPFIIMNSQITKNFKTWSIYLGCENIANFEQKNPIIDVKNPFNNDFDATMIWGPIHGRKIYAGFRWSFK
ncbi:MAG: TonB-dependent receptor [Prevotellaceae bacterium]|jgi:hypothetical protein|nr:TonB-dependent receptor [Prevotellaceae bacterium]